MSFDLDAYRAQRKASRRLIFWRSLAALVIALLVILLIGRWQGGWVAGNDYVALLNVRNVIRDDEAREAALFAVRDDTNARALIVHINSPGGTTTGGEALFLALRHVGAEKPVVAVIGTIGTSAAYLSAIAADHVLARETSLTGSIGVIMQTFQVTDMLDKIGVSTEAIKSSPAKGQPSPFEAISTEARQALETSIADSYNWFRTLVGERRGFDDGQLNQVADGRVFTGRQALQLKMIDAIGGRSAARDWLHQQHNIESDLPLFDVMQDQQKPWYLRTAETLTGKTLSIEPLMLDGLVSLWHPKQN